MFVYQRTFTMYVRREGHYYCGAIKMINNVWENEQKESRYIKVWTRVIMPITVRCWLLYLYKLGAEMRGAILVNSYGVWWIVSNDTFPSIFISWNLEQKKHEFNSYT